MSNSNRLYETTFIVNASLDDAQIEAVVGRVQDTIMTQGPVAEEEVVIPLGRADIKRSGTDVTLVTYSHMTLKCLEAATALESEGISVEVVDLRTLPLWIGTPFSTPPARQAGCSSCTRPSNAVGSAGTSRP